MAEIATEDGTREEEEEEEAASQERGEKEGEGEEEGGTTGNEGQASSQSGESTQANVSQTNLESDSDTEDEEEEVLVMKSSPASKSSALSNQTAPQTHAGVAQSSVSASRTLSPPSASPAGVPSVISGITVTESTAPPGTPPSPGRCISVSSPGRGHKIFMVTRVESPPEQPPPLPPIQTNKASDKPADIKPTTTQPPQPPPTSQTTTQTQLTQEDVKVSSPAPSTDCKVTEQSPVTHLESVVNVTQTHNLEPQSTTQRTDNVTAITLSPDVTDPSLQAPALPSDSSSAQAVAVQIPEGLTESTKSPQPELHSVEGNKDGHVGETKQSDELNKPQTSLPEQQLLVTSALEQLQNDLASASEEAPNQTEEALQRDDEQETTVSSSEKEGPSPKQQTETDKQEAESVLCVQADQQPSSVTEGQAQESNPSAEEASQSPDPASSGPEAVAEMNPDSPFEEEEEDESADESSADEGEVVGSALPNGLKPEFSLHLLDTESPKPGSCVMEHGESL